MAYRILVPLDGSPLAERSLSYLEAFKPIADLQVLLFSVTGSEPETAPESREGAEDREAYLGRLSLGARDSLGADISMKVAHGAVADTIIEEASAFDADLIIISTHGRSGFSRWRLGSVADKLIRAADSNTLVISPESADHQAASEAGLPRFASVLIPLDGSPLAEQALPLARWFEERLGTAIHLVRVVQTPVDKEDLEVKAGAGTAAEPAMVSHARMLVAGLMTDATAYLQQAASEVGPAVESAVLTGSPAAEIEAYATDKGIDLIVMTSHGRSGVARAALGSVTDRLIGGSVPVLVVRSQPADM